MPEITEKESVRIPLMNGREAVGELAMPFRADDLLVVLDGDAGKGEEGGSFPFSEVCAILSGGDGEELFPFDKRDAFERIKTVAGTVFHVRVPHGQKWKNGFFAVPIGDNPPCTLIFFFLHGISHRNNFQPLGEFLIKQGKASPAAVNAALNKQKTLKNRVFGEIIASRHNLSRKAVDNHIRQALKTLGESADTMKVGELLVHKKVISSRDLEDALAQQQEDRGKRVGDLLVEANEVDDRAILSALAEKFYMPFVDLAGIVPGPEALASLPEKMVRQMQVLPVEDRADRLVVATSNPMDPGIVDTLRFYVGRRVECVVATARQISEAIDMYYPAGKGGKVNDLLGEMIDADAVLLEKEKKEPDIDESDSQIIQLVNRILLDAYNRGASDVHFEPRSRNNPVLVRYRLDGVCHEAHNVPASYGNAVLSRLKIMADLDIAERRRPQSGKIIVRYKEQPVEFRIEITPTSGGKEDAVLRILTGHEAMALEEMGFMPGNLKRFKEILGKPHGLILCVGPTGSGKTTTLHSGLRFINTPKRKIWTAEDPVEISQPGLRQVQVHPKIGLTFKEALRSFMRADPDVIMIGEMRDRETADIAIEASLTGHLVLSTLHTNSAPETVVRLIEMGIDPFNFGDALLGVLAQRLVRRLCDCREPYTPDEREYANLVSLYGEELFTLYKLDVHFAEPVLMKRVGCAKCDQIGYRKRLAIHELLTGSREMKKAIKARITAEDLEELAISQGMNTLRMDGILKVFQGLTDLEEILAACPLLVSSDIDAGPIFP